MASQTLGTMTLDWNGPAFIENVNYAAAAGLNGAANSLAKKMRQNIGVQGPPRSSPGAYPKMDTTTLMKSLTTSDATPASLVAAAGVSKAEGYNKTGYGEFGFTHTNVSADTVGLWLEHGTSKMAPRPWAVRSMVESRNTLWGAFRSEFLMAYNSRNAGTPKGVPTRGVV